MLLDGISVLEQARREHRAIPGFVVYNLETAQGIVAAAERTQAPVLIMAGSSAFRHAGRDTLASLCLEAARRSSVSIGVHLDHCRSIEEISACLELGYTSVMFDGSHLPYADNVVLTQEVVKYAHQFGAWVEGELVGTAGDEDVSGDATAAGMTDPMVARHFVAETGIDALAVAIGNVHGYAAVEPTLDLARLEAIRDATPVPLVLHGASGLSRDTLLACVRRGVAKINVNTELRRAFLDAFGGALAAATEGADLVATLTAARAAVADAASAVIEVLADTADPAGSAGSASEVSA